MDGSRASGESCLDDCRGVEVGLGGWRGAYADGFICQMDMKGVGVCLRIDSDCGNGETFGCGDDPAGNFTSVGDEELVDWVGGCCE